MSRDGARRYIVAYDVQDDARRGRVARRLASLGDRVQYSVFILDTRPARIVRLVAELQRLIEPDEDSVLLCDVGPAGLADPDRFRILGRARPMTGQSVLIR